MSDDDLEFLKNYKANALYTFPGRHGAYAKLVGDSEHVIAEIDVTDRFRVAVSAFFVRDRADFGSFKITKLKFHKRFGWQRDGEVQVNHFQLAQLREFVAIVSSLDLKDAQKTRIELENIHVGALGALLSSSKGPALIKELATSPDLHEDIYAVAAKRHALAEFGEHLNSDLNEPGWQAFFERNSWIFGHGLNYVFLNKVGDKLENRTTGSAFDQFGKTADGLMRTRAEVSQYVLVEIKRDDTDLLRPDSYRAGCWGVSEELSNAVTQIQKTVFEFTRNRFRDISKDRHGNDTGESVYAVEPKSFLVIGNQTQLQDNDDKVACFELFRRNMRAPEILTFDELFQRAACIVENISGERAAPPPRRRDMDDDDDAVSF